MKLIKSTNTGANLSGWQIGLYTDADCTNAVSGSPYTTGADGTVTVSGLQKGTYYAKEIPTDDPYWEFDTAVKSVTVAVGQTAEVTFTNTHYGRIEIRKTTNTGNQLGGWTFRVKDSNGNTVGDFTTDDNGYACTGNLPLGRYTVVELATEDNYWSTEMGFHDVTVKAGETTADIWLNREQGLVWLYKKTNTGESVEGWHITVYADEACTQKVGTLITNSEGKAGYYLDPGSYWAKETGDEHGRFEDEYWMVDETVQKFEIKPHEDVSITFTNVQYGRLKITKTVEGGGSVESWQFKITDAEGKVLDGSPFSTDEDGIILTGNLLPGTYTVEELLPENSLYQCVSENPQTVTVKQGEIAEASFTNAMRSGRITIEKIDTAGEHLAGATFLLEWSAEGSLWYPVKYSKESKIMKTKIMKAIALCLALVLCFGSAISVSAAEVADATIDESQKGSLTIFKYDLTSSENAGIWDNSYVSTGVSDESGVNETMKNYTLEGVEFSFVKVADIVQFTESTADNRTESHVEVLYAIDKVQGADLLKALGLENGANRYQNADQMDSSKYFYQSDVLIQALSAALTANSTVVKNAMEAYIAAIGGTAMSLTDSFGKTKAENLELGLYLIVETKVPENVVSTTDPFLISLPMTSVNGTNATDGGTRWIYDVTVYPKNQTGDPTLEKTMRESKTNTGKNSGTSGITDGFAHTGTASGGDTVEYQIISTLPAITSESTYLTTYTFVDTLSKGLTYAKGDVVLEFFTDVACTDSVAKWTEADGKFTAAYNTIEGGETMTIAMTQSGLAEINTSKAVYSAANMVNSGYSDLTLRITYAAKLDSDNSAVFGDDGNPNQVTLTWKRTSTDYSDTLADDCHLYTYGIDLTKKFSDGNGDFSKVEFILHNETDNYYVKAELNEGEGVYYVTAHVANEADATHFIPVSSGKVVVKGLEDDNYRITEVRTDNGYTLLKEDIEVVISQTETASLCDNVNGSVEHHLLTASAKVDGNAVTMLADGSSANAEAPLTVVNTRGFDLPETGDNGTMMFTIVGILLMAGAVAALIIVNRKKSA